MPASTAGDRMHQDRRQIGRHAGSGDMIEFVMSRVWMVIVGLAMAAVILAAFGGLNENIADSRSMAGAEAIAGIIDDLEDEEGR
jgi:RsiW-degrading membrane proteinase PrsW (M82 family)